MPRKSEIKFHHYREIAAMATWWKAIFLTPIWAFLLIMPLGAFVRFYIPDMFGPGFDKNTFVGWVDPKSYRYTQLIDLVMRPASPPIRVLPAVRAR